MNQADLEKESLQIVKREGFADLQAQAAIDSIDVSEWHPLPDGQGKPTQVHVSMMIDGLDVPLVMRFKGPGALDALISALAVHRFHVWPDREAPTR